MKASAPPRSQPGSRAAAGSKPRFDPNAFLAMAGGGRTVATYAKDAAVFAQGEPADAVFYIRTGKVKITVVSAQGKEAVVVVLDADEFCGEGCLAGQPHRMATATAMRAPPQLPDARRLNPGHVFPGGSLSGAHGMKPYGDRPRASMEDENRISSSTASEMRANAWRGRSFCWRILARKVAPSRSSPRSVRRRSPR